jgi:hypothetical protein
MAARLSEVWCAVGGRTCIGDEDLGVFEAARAVDADALVEDEACHGESAAGELGRTLRTLVEVRVGQAAADLFDDLDVIEVGRALPGVRLCRAATRCRRTFNRRTASTARFAK